MGYIYINNINIVGPTMIPTLENIISISAGAYHSLVLNNMGEVYSFGANNNGRLGLGNSYHENIPKLIPTLKNIISISTGYYHSLALDRDGKVYGFGSNTSARLGLTDDTLFIPTLIPTLENIISISAGGIIR